MTFFIFVRIIFFCLSSRRLLSLLSRSMKSSILFYAMWEREVSERTKLKEAQREDVRTTVRWGQLAFCLLERKRVRFGLSPSSSSDVHGGPPLLLPPPPPPLPPPLPLPPAPPTAPRDEVACISSWSGTFLCSYRRMLSVSS